MESTRFIEHENETNTYYERNAGAYFQDTHNINVTELRNRFLRHVPKGGSILDAGSGSGRDTKAFMDLGFYVTAFDLSSELAALSTRYTGIQTRVASFLEIDYDSEFDGVWACASLLHLRRVHLPEALRKLSNALKHGGSIYLSFKYGTSERVDARGRFFTDMTEDSLTELLLQGGFEIVELWRYRPNNRREDSEGWLNAIAVKP